MSLETQRRLTLGCELIASVARNFGEVRLKVTGASMMPAIWPGDVITVRRCNTAELRPGQIMLYRRGETLVAHRIICIRDALVTTRGDSLQYDDPPTVESDIVGQVVSLVRNGRRANLKQSARHRIVSSILRRSDFCMRMTLRLRRLQAYASREKSWVR